MTATAIPYPSRLESRFPWTILVLAALVLAAVVYGVHAYERHGAIADQVRQCLENQGPVLQVQNPITGRIAKACPLDGRFGIQILEQDGEHEVTSFKNKSKTIDQLLQYLRNAGYFQ